MANKTKFGFLQIVELGNIVSEYLQKCNVTDGEIIVKVDETDFVKIDENLYYHNNGEEDKYIPSCGTINVKFNNCEMNIKSIKQHET